METLFYIVVGVLIGIIILAGFLIGLSDWFDKLMKQIGESILKKIEGD